MSIDQFKFDSCHCYSCASSRSTANGPNWWRWCWWHRYVGDWFQMLVAESLCWRLFRYSLVIFFVGDLSPTSRIGHEHLKLVINTFGLRHPSPTSSPLNDSGFTRFDQFKYFGIDFFKPGLSENILGKFLNGREFVPVVTGCPCHCTSHSVTQIGYCYFITLKIP